MTRRAKVRAWRIETRDDDGRGWYGFVAAADEDEARGEGERCFDETVTGITGPFEIDALMVTNR